MNRAMLLQFVKFAMVGGIGFSIEGCVLFVLVRQGADPLISRLISFPAAVIATWSINRCWTFGIIERSSKHGAEFTKYAGIQCVGALVNYAVYAVALKFTGVTPLGALAALFMGAAIGLVVNFTGAKVSVFAGHDSAIARKRNARTKQ